MARGLTIDTSCNTRRPTNADRRDQTRVVSPDREHISDDDHDDDTDDVRYESELLYSHFLSQRLAEERLQFPHHQDLHFDSSSTNRHLWRPLTADRFDRWVNNLQFEL